MQKLYEEAARKGSAEAAVQSGDPFRDSAEASLDLLLQEQQQKLRVRSTLKVNMTDTCLALCQASVDAHTDGSKQPCTSCIAAIASEILCSISVYRWL